MPQIAKRLSHVGARQLPERIPMRRPFPGKGAAADPLNYQNGPVNGLCDIQNCDVDAWTVNFGYAVTDSFSGSGTVNSLTFAFWLIPGDNVSRLQWSIGSAPYASDLGQGFSSTSLRSTFPPIRSAMTSTPSPCLA